MNVIAEEYTPEISAAVEPFIYELVGESCSLTQLREHSRLILSCILRSVISWLSIRRTRDRVHEDPRAALFQDRCQRGVHAKNQKRL